MASVCRNLKTIILNLRGGIISFINVEIKARSSSPDKIKVILKQLNAKFEGVDHQIETYFSVPSGRLKLREGKIENALIYYQRGDRCGPKLSNISLYKSKPDPSLKEVLDSALGVKVVVDKKREIYWIKNVKFHIDEVLGLGGFVEIEAIDYDGKIGKDKLGQQCDYYIHKLEIDKEDLITCSYSDLILNSEGGM